MSGSSCSPINVRASIGRFAIRPPAVISSVESRLRLASLAESACGRLRSRRTGSHFRLSEAVRPVRLRLERDNPMAAYPYMRPLDTSGVCHQLDRAYSECGDVAQLAASDGDSGSVSPSQASSASDPTSYARRSSMTPMRTNCAHQDDGSQRFHTVSWTNTQVCDACLSAAAKATRMRAPGAGYVESMSVRGTGPVHRKPGLDAYDMSYDLWSPSE